MATIGFEDKLWEMADALRGNIASSDYKYVILGLVFLKYVSDTFQEKYDELQIEDPEFAEDRDEYIAEGIFWVPEKARWAYIAEYSKQAEIGQIIDQALAEIEKENDSLKGVLTKNYSRPELDKQKLGQIVDIFTNISVGGEVAREQDILGRVYEYFLGKFAANEGQNGGEFYTPKSIVKLMVEMVEPYKGYVYDPACGSGGMFVQSQNFVREHSGNILDISVYGQEYNSTTWKLAKMNLAIRGIENNLGSKGADTFSEDLHPNLKADYILANPPFNIKNWGGEALQDDSRWKWGVPPTGNANYAWLSHMVDKLNQTGIAAVVLANGSLSSNTSNEGEIRKNFIEANLVDCIVALPSNLFYSATIPVCIWFLNRNKKQKGKTLFIDARSKGEMVTRALRELTDTDIRTIADTYLNYKHDTNYEDILGFCKVVTTEEIQQHDYILTPGRYVGLEEVEDDGIPFNEKMEEFVVELGNLFAQSHELEEAIKVNLGGIGYEF